MPDSQSSLDDDLDFALMLAAVGERIAMERQSERGLTIDIKRDGSPVTDSDRTVERRLRQLLERWLPGDACLGEEFGQSGHGPRRWIIDPIDGTTNYVAGRHDWAVLVALEVCGTVEVGVVAAPLLGATWWAARGRGAYRNGVPLHARRSNGDGDLVVTARALRHAQSQQLPQLVAEAMVAATTVDQSHSFWPELLVAEGHADLDACPAAKVWDLAPRQILVEEAGAVFTDLQGRSRCDTGSSLCCSNMGLQARLSDQVEALAS